jgi:hypothetical protein
MVRLAETRHEGQHHATPPMFRHSTDSVAKKIRDDIGLRKLRMAGVQNDGLTLFERVIEDP